jgi:hypothetical protein
MHSNQKSFVLSSSIPKAFAVAGAAALVILSSGCVSVNLGGGKGPERSKDVRFEAPGGPFQKLQKTQADAAWQNPANGNSISYLSTCNESSDPGLETATEEMISVLGETKTLTQKSYMFDGRAALDTEAEAKVEGVPTKIRTLVFKKNGCLYTLSLLGVSKTFSDDQKYFDHFVKGFTAP